MAQKPTFILRGRIVTMNDDLTILNDGYIAIKNGIIAAIEENLNDLPVEFSGKPMVETGGTIYPGLIDLHNHFAYNVLPLWRVPKEYNNRSQWRSNADYQGNYSKPLKEVLVKYTIPAKALVRYVEAKALFGGTTTGQGINTAVDGGPKSFRGAMRNVEQPDDPNLLPAGTMIGDLNVGAKDSAKRIAAFRKSINNPGLAAYYYHLSEGVDDVTRQHFLNLKQHDLLTNKLVGIHSLGLQQEDLNYLGQKGSKIVWSPFSNSLLYGNTLNLSDLKNSGAIFSLGCDWSPSGSKNLLEELKVAKFVNTEQGNVFTDAEIVKMVTINAAKVAGWHSKIGSLETTKYADLVVIDGTAGDPYNHLISAVDKSTTLVVVDGVCRYGNIDYMKKLHFDTSVKLEKLTVGNIEKGIYLYSETSPINEIGFNDAVKTLKTIMADIPGFLGKMKSYHKIAYELVGEPQEQFTVILDNEYDEQSEMFPEDEYLKTMNTINTFEAIKDLPMPQSVEFDEPFVGGDLYRNRINAQTNISQALKDHLINAYYS
jgi:5-methylthioadenosine/S-adenosylhomocysteine deaminase